MKNSQYVRQAQYKKGFVVPLLLAIIAVLVIGGGVYVYQSKKAEAPAVVDAQVQQTNNSDSVDTANWKTYTNEKYGFSFQYPASVDVHDDCCQGGMVADLSVYPSKSTDSTSEMELLDKAVFLQLHDDDYQIFTAKEVREEGPNYMSIKLGKRAMNISIFPSGDKDLFKIITSTFKFTSATNVTIENASGIIKSVYNKSGKNYIDIDYIEWNPSWVPGGAENSIGPTYYNNNPQIRTFEISANAKFLVGGFPFNSITFSDFKKYFTSDGYQKLDPWEIVITNGVVTQITEHFLS